ncbi:hypothetical protein V8B97DRAFT_1976408, partial [Scleroderma yunnanense]
MLPYKEVPTAWCPTLVSCFFLNFSQHVILPSHVLVFCFLFLMAWHPTSHVLVSSVLLLMSCP